MVACSQVHGPREYQQCRVIMHSHMYMCESWVMNEFCFRKNPHIPPGTKIKCLRVRTFTIGAEEREVH